MPSKLASGKWQIIPIKRGGVGLGVGWQILKGIDLQKNGGVVLPQS